MSNVSVYISVCYTYTCDAYAYILLLLLLLYTHIISQYFRRYVAVVIIPLKIHVPQDGAVEVKIICGYVQETAYPVI